MALSQATHDDYGIFGWIENSEEYIDPTNTDTDISVPSSLIPSIYPDVRRRNLRVQKLTPKFSTRKLFSGLSRAIFSFACIALVIGIIVSGPQLPHPSFTRPNFKPRHWNHAVLRLVNPQFLADCILYNLVDTADPSRDSGSSRDVSMTSLISDLHTVRAWLKNSSEPSDPSYMNRAPHFQEHYENTISRIQSTQDDLKFLQETRKTAFAVQRLQPVKMALELDVDVGIDELQQIAEELLKAISPAIVRFKRNWKQSNLLELVIAQFEAVRENENSLRQVISERIENKWKEMPDYSSEFEFKEVYTRDEDIVSKELSVLIEQVRRSEKCKTKFVEELFIRLQNVFGALQQTEDELLSLRKIMGKLEWHKDQNGDCSRPVREGPFLLIVSHWLENMAVEEAEVLEYDDAKRSVCDEY